MTPIWLRPWPDVCEVYARLQRLKERIEREALACGINCRLKREARDVRKA